MSNGTLMEKQHVISYKGAESGNSELGKCTCEIAKISLKRGSESDFICSMGRK